MLSLPAFADPDDVRATDDLGNPVCPWCLETVVGMAARHNSGDTRPCMCPPQRKDISEPRDLAWARALIHRVADTLARLDHDATCTCAACDALRQIQGPGLYRHLDALQEHRDIEELVAPVSAALREQP